ncbi:hypothetical protein G5I_03619 [Acromyrmex echinatior]|uniref:Uncharacterized protein n=1 Tax=Acromyrmex echinatior TaxID=103372 RepID=F4WDG6_ACREC|nr:hypothetical protein G5I_03619 [Acromyrmex echinatior]
MIKDGGRYEVHRHWYNRRLRRQPYDEMPSLEPPCRVASDEYADREISREWRSLNGKSSVDDPQGTEGVKSLADENLAEIGNRDFVFQEEFDERSSLSRAHER